MLMNHNFHGPVARALSRIYGNRNVSGVMGLLATDLLHSCGVSGPPFNPFDYANALGISVKFADLQADGVFVSGTDKQKKILLRETATFSKSMQKRTNFTLAHELGHFVIHESLTGNKKSQKFRSGNIIEDIKTDEEEERLCDVFASELLMPRDWLLKDLAAVDLTPEAVCNLSNRYNVSLQAMMTRISFLAPRSTSRERTVIGIIWLESQGYYRVHWATPFEFKRAILCDSGKTSVEKAAVSPATQNALDSILVAGKRSRWQASSRRLSREKLLTILIRGTKTPFGNKRDYERKKDCIEAPVTVQPFLPF